MLGNIICFIPITDPARARSFYEGKLGLQFRHEDDFAISMQSGQIFVRLTKLPAWTPAQHTILGWDVIDIKQTVSRLRQLGIIFEHYEWMGSADIWDAPAGTKVAWFKDPDGNVLSITQK